MDKRYSDEEVLDFLTTAWMATYRETDPSFDRFVILSVRRGVLKQLLAEYRLRVHGPRTEEVCA